MSNGQIWEKAITSRDAYLRMGDDHVRKDMEIGDAECERIQAELNGHVSCWTKCFLLGDHHDQQVRTRETTPTTAVQYQHYT